MPMQYSLVSSGDESFITVFVPGEAMPLVAQSDHPNFKAIVGAVVAGDNDLTPQEVADLFDVTKAIERKFQKLSERVSVGHGRVYFDGDEVNNALAKQIIRFIDEGVEDFKPLVAFFEKVADNPNEHSREQLYEWLDRHAFTITEDGDIVGYKGVASDGEGGYKSINSGPGIVDGVELNGQLPNNPGSVVEISRSYVHHDPSVGCSTGLHVGTYEYARSFARGAVLEVHVNPRDVVSVPTDCDWQKVRCCRYTVVDVIEVPYTSSVIYDDVDDPEGDYDDEYCGDCGEYPEYCYCGEDDEPEDDGEDGCDDPSCALCYPDYDESLSDRDRVTVNGDLGVIVGPHGDGSLNVDLDSGNVLPYDSVADALARGVKRVVADPYSGAVSDPYAGVRDSHGRFSQGRPGSLRDPNSGRFA